MKLLDFEFFFDKLIFSNYNECRVSEWVVIIGIREIQKNMTREKIIHKTRELLLQKGFVKVSSKEISSQCGVSQGTIFLHFSAKDILLNHIISESISEFLREVEENCDPTRKSDEFISTLLDTFSKHEDMISRVYKDYYYLSDHLVKGIEKVESKIKNLIFENHRKYPSKSISIVDSFIAIDAFYSQVRVNLTQKEVFSETNSVIRQSRGKLMKLYKSLFQ